MVSPQTFQLSSIVLIFAVAGVMNSIAGGGTLVTFPALVGLRIPPIVANATRTVRVMAWHDQQRVGRSVIGAARR